MRYRVLFSYSRLLARSKSISIPSTPRSSPGTDLFTFFFRGKNTRRRRRSRVRNYRRANNSISASRGFDGGIFNWSIRIVTRVTFSKDWRATSEELCWLGRRRSRWIRGDGATCKIAAYLRWNCNYDKLESLGGCFATRSSRRSVTRRRILFSSTLFSESVFVFLSLHPKEESMIHLLQRHFNKSKNLWKGKDDKLRRVKFLMKVNYSFNCFFK